jgi:hypothetical protein
MVAALEVQLTFGGCMPKWTFRADPPVAAMIIAFLSAREEIKRIDRQTARLCATANLLSLTMKSKFST